ncbi:UNVERIFIED_CONTAM: hypothetical protein GTU68_059338, partial [Idotea baltica]|nr:hypothetical protein [Idotea baltica]
KTAFLTTLALIAFAGNSVFNRLALAGGTIDAGSFTALRLLSGVFVLMIILGLSERNPKTSNGSWRSGLMLFIYAICFSYAYISLETGTGALILFAAVQITMISVGLYFGNKLSAAEWVGVFIAFGGFAYLMLPGASAPSLTGFALMCAAGIAWGLYTLAGKSSTHPLSDTGFNFLRTLPLVLLLALLLIASGTISFEVISLKGAVLAALSGGLASGVGYTIWYMALNGLSAVQAAVLQLLVPIIATIGGVVFASEPVTARFIISTALVLGGILVVILGKRKNAKI